MSSVLEKKQFRDEECLNGPTCYYRSTGRYGCCNSNWNNWGRWVLFGAIVVFFAVFILAFACINSRRRRRAGLSPRYGTGWAAQKPWGSAPPYGQGQPAPPYQAAPPVYNQHTGNTFNSNDGYYGQQQTGIELQQPQNTYQPPAGAPPGKA